MKIVVFDIDGTLTMTSRVDGHYFSASVRKVLKIPLEPDWSQFAEVTDSAILATLCAKHSTRDYNSVEAEVQEHFFAGLNETANTDPDAFRPVRGAREIFARVRRAGWTPAIATGGWRRSAEIKLAAAGIPTDDTPLATSSDYPRRVDIIRRSVLIASGHGPSSHVVFVGDGLWDLRAAGALQIGFIGRAEDNDARPLLESGAPAVIPHFGDSTVFVSLLNQSVPL